MSLEIQATSEMLLVNLMMMIWDSHGTVEKFDSGIFLGNEVNLGGVTHYGKNMTRFAREMSEGE